MENSGLLNVVSAILAKDSVKVGADNKNGVWVAISPAHELTEMKAQMPLSDLIKLVDNEIKNAL